MNAVLMCWTFFASGLGLLFGLFLCFSPFGNAGAGIAFTLMFGLLGYMAIKLARETWGRRRYYYVDDGYQAVQPRSLAAQARAQHAERAKRAVVRTTGSSRDAA